MTILRFTATQDVGTAIHPSYVEGQIQGGVAQGIGMALTEEYHYGADGRMQNSTYLDYRMPTALDLPMIETVLVEVPNPGHPYGVRGVGEVLHRPAAGGSPGRDRRGHRRALQRPADSAAEHHRRAVRRRKRRNCNLKGRWVRPPPLYFEAGGTQTPLKGRMGPLC